MLGLYDLLDAGVAEPDLTAWLGGRAVPGLPPLSTRERRAIGEAWWFWARPGQRWEPGPEFITDFECGRGFGKDYLVSQTICQQAALDPERWGGYAIVVGPDPTQVKRDCLFGPSGIFPAAERAARSGNGPAIVDRNLVDRWLRFEAPRGGGSGGLTVYWAASSDPKSVHGANVGLVWWDEFGVSYHRRYDEQGNNAWRALLPAVRLGADPKIIITQTPSRAPEVRALQADAERPECPRCRAEALARGPYVGAPLQEPWRLPRSPQRRLHPNLDTRTTEPVRECPACGARVVARVRTVFGATTDNPALAARARDDAARELEGGTSAARLRFAPRGEADAGGEGALIRHEHVLEVTAEPPHARPGGPIPDLHMRALDELGADEVIVFVDPAVTASESSDETGLVAACMRRAIHVGREVRQVVGLTDASVRPDEVVGGPPSAVWAPRAYWQAVAWGARRIVVEVNQGGEEVLSAVRDLCARPPTEAECLARLRGEHPAAGDAQLGLLARRLAASARGVVVEAVRRRAPKPARAEWYGRTASLGQQSVLCVEWQGGARHWQTCVGQGTGYEPPRADAPASARRDRKDRWDALCAAGQVLLGVRETARGDVEDAPGPGWMGQVSGAALR